MKKNERKIILKSTKAITLIALVVTIIVLLILAGISISMLSGNNGLLNRTTEARERTIHAHVFEQLQIEELAHLTDTSTLRDTSTLIGYLQSKSIIGDEIGEDTGKYQVNVTALLGSRQSLGNGDATVELKDVYILEKQNVSSGSIVNTKVATTQPIRIAATSTTQITYKVMYYGNGTSENLTLGSLKDNNDFSSIPVEEDPFTLRYEYGYLWVDFKQSTVANADSLTEEQKQTVLDNYLLFLRDSFEEEGDTEEQIESKISDYQSMLSSFNSAQKQQIISGLLNAAFKITPEGTDLGYVWSAKYSRMLIRETGNYTATLCDFLATPYKKVEKSINIQNLDEYIIDLGTDQYDYNYYISFKHFENNEYITAYADRVVLKLDGVEMFNGVPPEHDGASLDYWYFQEMNNNIENNKEYMADITGYFGTKEVKFNGKITIKFPY